MAALCKVERVTPNYYTQGSDPGVSLEYMVRLSNEVGAEPWFSLPVSATDNYIELFMSFISETWTARKGSSASIIVI